MLIAKQSAHLDGMVMIVKMSADAIIIHHVKHKPENVYATKDGAAKTVQNHVKLAITV